MVKIQYKELFILGCFFLVGSLAYGQVGIGTATVSDAAMLEVASQKGGEGDFLGFMPARVPDEAARDSIETTEDDRGLLVFVISTGCLDAFDGENWVNARCFGAPNPKPTAPLEDVPNTDKTKS